MASYISACQIRYEALIAKLLNIEDERHFFFLRLITKFFGSQKDSQFEWHVETREIVLPVGFGARDVMNAVSALANQSVEPVQPKLAAIIELLTGSRTKTAGKDCKNQCLEKLSIFGVKWTVNKNVVNRRGFYARQIKAALCWPT